MAEPAVEEQSPTEREGVPLREAGANRWVVPRSYKPQMRTEGLIFASAAMIPSIQRDKAAEQVANVACLPGLVGQSLAMPDIHLGYGFPIGGVAAFDADDGVVSPGGVGYDINCGVRLIRSNLTEKDVAGKIKDLVDQLFRLVPSGIGGKGAAPTRRIEDVLESGAEWAVEQGYGWTRDLDHLEEGGRMKDADQTKVSGQAKKRGRPQLGSLGAGNHFLEVQVVDRIEDEKIARAYGLNAKGQVCVMLHTGSRGLGHQTCSDHLETLESKRREWNIELPDRQLACAPMTSPVAEDYLGAMMAGANFAWANRTIITHQVREGFKRVFNQEPEELALEVVYDVSHNMAKVEEHAVDGKRRRLVVHRKGATRAFGPGHPQVPAAYRDVGQPVLVPGDMATGSWVLAGTNTSMKEAWGSCCHGAGRQLSRHASNRQFDYGDVTADLRRRGVHIHALTRKGVTEEAPGAYKDVDQVVNVVHDVGLGKKVARLRPIGVIKG